MNERGVIGGEFKGYYLDLVYQTLDQSLDSSALVGVNVIFPRVVVEWSRVDCTANTSSEHTSGHNIFVLILRQSDVIDHCGLLHSIHIMLTCI